MMYHDEVRRLQISIDDDLDEALAVEAARRHTSRAALIREFVRQQLRPDIDQDPFGSLIGDIDEEAGDIDDVVYGR
jgi:plasmid stability protein